MLLLSSAGCLLVLALADPRLGTREVPVPTPAKPLVLLLDVSRSMAVEDVLPSRLGAARILVRRVLPRVPASPVGLFVFAGEPHLLLPPSTARSLLLRYLDTVDPGMLTRQGTTLAPALREVLEGLRSGALEPGTVFLVLSDGEDHGDAEEVLSLAREVKEAGGSIAALSLGTSEGGVVRLGGTRMASLMSDPFEAETGEGDPYSRARPGFLARLTEVGGGAFARGVIPGEVSALLAWLGERGGVGDGMELEEVATEGWPWVLALALGLRLVELAVELPEKKKDSFRQ
jgi:Ca-activated chloride channel family protein